MWINFNPQAGHEQANERPALVLLDEQYNRRLRLAIMCPITTRRAPYRRDLDVSIPPDVTIRNKDSIGHSVTLGLEFHALDDSLGIYDPEAEAWLKTSAERAEDAEERANQEADARHKAESEVARLQAELERLKARL